MSGRLSWSDRVRLDQIGTGLKRHLEAEAADRAQIAQALNLADLGSLKADVEIKPTGAGWHLAGVLHADVVQTCGVTLEPLPSRIDTQFSVDVMEAMDGVPHDDEFDIDLSVPDQPDIIEDGAVDLAAYVVEYLALAIDPWPRKPGAVFEPPTGPVEPSPFEVLRDLKPRS